MPAWLTMFFAIMGIMWTIFFIGVIVYSVIRGLIARKALQKALTNVKPEEEKGENHGECID